MPPSSGPGGYLGLGNLGMSGIHRRQTTFGTLENEDKPGVGEKKTRARGQGRSILEKQVTKLGTRKAQEAESHLDFFILFLNTVQ